MGRCDLKPNGKIQHTEEPQRSGEIQHPVEEERTSRTQLIRALLSKVEKEFNPKETKVTLADFVRLVQLERELEEEEQPREIIIRWSEPVEKQSTER